MSSYLRLLASAVALLACGGSASLAGEGQDQRRGQASPAIALEHEVRRLAATRGSLWPGFDPLAIPLAVYDGERTLLFRHPAPPREFVPIAAAALTIHVCKGRQEAVTANTNAEIGGVSTATVMLDRAQPDRALVDLAAIAIHEAFHVHQRARHPGWIGNEADLFTYPTDSATILALRRLETDALRQALAARDAAGAACWARRALALRTQRFARMDSVFAVYERGTELNEGLATYVEMRAAGRRRVDLPAAEFGPAEVRRRAYATGAALAQLLDRFVREWPAEFEADDRQTLEAALTRAVGPGESCTLGEPALAAAQQQARVDIAALAAERAQKLDAFEGRRGWRVVVESGGGDPLWPQGFDPLNVDRMGAERVLHSRFLRLGNGAGALEVLGAQALTDGIGPHPLFQGIRQVMLTGLEEPEVSETEGKVRVRAPGLTLEFKGAMLARSGTVITVRVGP